MHEFLQHILGNPLQSSLVVLNLIVIESLLSVDNAAVLATMVMDLPASQRSSALKYGILGAYLFRGICLFLATTLVKVWWLKPFGGFYLLYLVWKWWKVGRKGQATSENGYDKHDNRLYRSASGSIGAFWATVVLIEVMDLAFSIDNVFAAVAFTDNIILICFGVFIGILAMRFVAQGFVRLMERYTFLNTCAFIVIGILGLKLSLSVIEYIYPASILSRFIVGHDSDVITTGLTIAIFFVPVMTSTLFNFPVREGRGARVTSFLSDLNI
jgi:YkoY family integral membrane protein